MKTYFNFVCLLISLLILPSVLSAQPDNLQCIWHTTGNYPNSKLGRYLVAAGDMNGDGFDDIIASAWEDSAVYLYFGGNPMDTIPDIVFQVPHNYEFGSLPRECKDLNGDGYPDFTIQGDSIDPPYNFLYLFYGSPDMDNQPDLIYSADSVGYFQNDWGDYSSLGDFNGDGDDDLVVSCYGYQPFDLGNGKVYVYFGGPDIDNIPDWDITGDYNNYGNLGELISCSGDINNDGCNDILCMGNSDGNGEGIVLFHGGLQPDTLVDWEIQSDNYFIEGGISIIPDFNVDNCDEVVYGTGSDAYVYFGGINMDTQSDVHLYGTTADVSSLGGIGDINDDGWDDFALVNGGSTVNIFLLNPNIIGDINPQINFQVPYAKKIKYAGDVNGDGKDEFVINTGYNSSGYNWQGQILIYSYNTNGVADNPVVSLYPALLTLEPCYPNPFNSQTVIPFEISGKSEISLSIYDLLGRRISDLLNVTLTEGSHQIVWNAQGLSTGTYYIRLSDGNNTDTQCVQLIK